jgi:hypothetical protein
VLLRVFWVNVAPAGCVHACSKWQTSVRAEGDAFGSHAS